MLDTYGVFTGVTAPEYLASGTLSRVIYVVKPACIIEGLVNDALAWIEQIRKVSGQIVLHLSPVSRMPCL